MDIFGKVVSDAKENILLETELGPGFTDKIELGEFLEEYLGKEVVITIHAVERRHYSKDDQFTEGGTPDVPR